MATNFPGSVDNLTNPTASDKTTSPSHAAQHANANDAIEAIETFALTHNHSGGANGASVVYAEKITVTGTGWSGTPIAKDITVTFPSGRFITDPIVTATFAANTNNSHVSVEVKSVSTTSATLRIICGDSYWSTNTSYVNVMAVAAAT